MLPAELLVEIWRTVAAQLELDAILPGVLEALARRWSVTSLQVAVVDAGGAAPRVLAGAALGGAALPALGRSDAPPTGLVGRVRVLRPVVSGASGGPAPGALEGVLIELGPDERGGLALALAHGPGLGAAVDALSGIAEPLRVALGHDRVIGELARRREAAEADARALRARVPPEELNEFIVGERGGLRTVMTLVDQVAPTDVPVLILGETGSGKEVVARAVHNRSSRASGPFLKVNCGAIPSELVDSELFGHEKGSFTGAVAMRRGWFERADGGTLFLDELGELPAAAQVRLLRVLQDGEFERVGGQRALRTSIRIVAATHRDMREMLHGGSFREDLWYRLSVFPIRLPPLRERLDDIEPLARHFAESAGQRLYTKPLSPTTEDVALLRAYPWPGNVRELAAVIDRAAILGYGRRLEIASALGVSGPPAPRSDRPMDTVTLEAANREAIEAALRRTHGRIEGDRGAAAVLGINPHTLRARMRKLGVEWARYRD
jgi:transcriptional regulator with GAF, ATPase, and Fis domain